MNDSRYWIRIFDPCFFFFYFHHECDDSNSVQMSPLGAFNMLSHSEHNGTSTTKFCFCCIVAMNQVEWNKKSKKCTARKYELKMTWKLIAHHLFYSSCNSVHEMRVTTNGIASNNKLYWCQWIKILAMISWLSLIALFSGGHLCWRVCIL